MASKTLKTAGGSRMYRSTEARNRLNDQLKHRAADLLTRELRFVFSTEFSALDGCEVPIAEATELLEQLRETSEQAQAQSSRQSDSEDRVGSSLDWSSSAPLLTFAEEQILFRAMNLLRYRINQLRSRLSERSPSVRIMEKIETMFAIVEQIRAQLVQSNLRLVSSIARKFSTTSTDVDEFSSDGCMILLGAIDRFDYSRGFRFSTYATHSVQRHFYRLWKTRQRRRERFICASSERLNEVADVPADEPICSDPGALVRSLMTRANEVLEVREQQILAERFGLAGDSEGRTLREVAADLGISKERVRQLQTKALEKLRHLINPESINPGFVGIG
jgi:RNA polymerase primary sigma factor